MGVSHTVRLGRASPRKEDQHVKRPWGHHSVNISTSQALSWARGTGWWPRLTTPLTSSHSRVLDGAGGATEHDGLLTQEGAQHVDISVVAFVVQFKGTDLSVSSVPRLWTVPELTFLDSWRSPHRPPPSVQMGELRPREGKGPG